MRTSLYAKEETAKKSLLKLVKRCSRFFINSSLKQEFLMIFRFMKNRRNIELKNKLSTKNGMFKKSSQTKIQLKILIKSSKVKIRMLQRLNSKKSAKSFMIDLIFKKNKTISNLFKILTTRWKDQSEIKMNLLSFWIIIKKKILKVLLEITAKSNLIIKENSLIQMAEKIKQILKLKKKFSLLIKIRILKILFNGKKKINKN